VGGFAQEAAVAKSIASYGITYSGHHTDIVRAHCRGLRRYGVHRSGSLDSYHRLNCVLAGADRNVYEAQVVIIRSSSTGFSWQILSGTRSSQPGG
jgi:allophanate hydrolase subunit 2